MIGEEYTVGSAEIVMVQTQFDSVNRRRPVLWARPYRKASEEVQGLLPMTSKEGWVELFYSYSRDRGWEVVLQQEVAQVGVGEREYEERLPVAPAQEGLDTRTDHHIRLSVRSDSDTR